MNLIFLFLTTVLSPIAFADDLNKTGLGQIRLTAEGLKSTEGGIIFNLYNSKNGFPDNPKLAFKTMYISPIELNTTTRFINVPYGTYAVAVCHDEDKNKKCNTNFIGIPTEAVGVSNNAKGFMGPPNYKDSQFTLEQSEIALNIKLK